MKKFSEITEYIEQVKDTHEFLPTGFHKLDDFLDGGFMRKELCVLGGSTGKGKSFIAGQVFSHIASKGFKSAYFSLEISNEMVASRLIGSRANLKPTRIMVGFLTEQEQQQKIEAKAELSVYEEFMYFYDDIYSLTALNKEIKEQEYEFVVVDFIQNVVSQQTDEYARLSYIALELQKLAKETNSCILVLSQLSNTVSRERNSNVVEYKGSGSIATVCDLGFFIEQQQGNFNENNFSIKLRKNRRGISGVSWDFTFKQPGGHIVQL